MNQQPDKLFREKLEGFIKPAPASAWGKIAAAQTKKNNKGLWLKIAASLLLLAIASYLLWPKNETIGTQQNILTEASKEQPADIPTLQDKQEQNTIAESDVPQKPLLKTEETSTKRRKVRRTTSKSEQIQEVTIAQETNLQTTESLAISEEINSDNVATGTESTEAAIAETEFTVAPATQNITLVFTAKEVSEYLDKKALAQATSDEKKPSTLKKLLMKANDLKTNQDPFGELRQKKNEILALNFKNEKQRGQNK